MKRQDWLFWLLAAIAAGTVTAGGTQLIAPSLVLKMVGGSIGPNSRFFFAIVGMFMVLFGGMMLHVLFSPTHHPIPVLWAGLQKLGAALAVGIGVKNGTFSSLALVIAGFDFVSCVFLIMYWRRELSSEQNG